jgi:membrane-bound lytic murein transglycosylase B
VTTSVTLVAVALATSPALLSPAHADTTGQASAKVQALLAKVHDLQAKARAAEATYSRAINGVADSVHAAISADQRSNASAGQAAAAQAQLTARVRGLYESGGELAAEAAILSSGSFTAISDRTEFIRSAVAVQVASVHAASAAANQAASKARVAARRAHHKIGTERNVGVAATRVQHLLAAQQALLQQANQHLAAVRAATAALAAQTGTFSSITSSAISSLHVLPPSAAYLAWYKAASTTCSGLSWTVLAAIGQVESGHGRNPSTSSSGAMGPMQFLPSTFAAYAVDGDHDGTSSIMDPADAIYTAAHYLCADGAGYGPGGLVKAILHYNHAIWYEQMVMRLAGMYAAQYG